MDEIQKKMGRFSLYIIQHFHYSVYLEHVIFCSIYLIVCQILDWTDLAEDKNQWRVNMSATFSLALKR